MPRSQEPYRDDLSQQAADTIALVERHAPLVKRIAFHLLARLPDSVQVDDLIQSGLEGLLEAANNYDASKGASFETLDPMKSRAFQDGKRGFIVDAYATAENSEELTQWNIEG